MRLHGAMSMQALLTVEQLAEYLRKSVASIRSDATRNPMSLPPICRLPGTKRLLWRQEDVDAWLARYVEANSETSDLAAVATPSTRRGRPTKASQVAKQRLLRGTSSGSKNG